ncbi:MAG: DUF4476 domain-containing protein [Flavobacteriales bacterium]|nr:DUF4476 domain-containing protein [Flavobacteriales bacterium]
MKRILTITLIATTTSVLAQDTDVDVNVNMGGMGVDMNVNISETYTETHTTTTTSTTGGGQNHYVMSGYSGPIGCPWPMDDAQYADAKNSVTSKTFDDAKLTIAKQITGSNCLTASQVRDLMKELDFEDSKLEYAKFAYNRTYDLGNYYKLNDAFDFDSSIDELNEYINNAK